MKKIVLPFVLSLLLGLNFACTSTEEEEMQEIEALMPGEPVDDLPKPIERD